MMHYQPDDPADYDEYIKRLVAREMDGRRQDAEVKPEAGNQKLAWLVVSALFVVLTGEFAWFGGSVVSLREQMSAVEAKIDLILTGRITVRPQ